MKKIISLCFVVLAFACSNKEQKATNDKGWDVTISGKVKFPGQGPIIIQELGQPDAKLKKDSVTAGADGAYSVTMHITEPGFYRVNFYNTQLIDLALDKSNIELNVDGNDQSGEVEIKGSPDYDLIRNVQEKLAASQNTPEIQNLERDFQIAGRSNNTAEVARLQEKYMELHNASLDSLVAYLETQPVNLGMINLLSGRTLQDKDRYYTFYKKAADKAVADMPTSTIAKEFADMVQKMGVTAIGQKAPEISMPDPDGKVVTLSSFQGKYVLVDFWAKWCGPCRKENPNVVKAYNKFHPKGFEVLGVSLDRSKEDWVEAIKQDGLVWTQVSDLKYYESKAASDYNVQAIPFSLLVDPNGVIIAKNLRGSALEKKLTEVYSK